MLFAVLWLVVEILALKLGIFGELFDCMNNNVLPKLTADLLEKMQRTRWISDFYLAGGTGLALQYHHRQSIDLDWFTTKEINTVQLIKKLSKVGKFELVKEEENTVEGLLDGVKVSFMTYPYTPLQPLIFYAGYVSLAGSSDIALMKLNAIAGRNTKKDFIDLYFFLQQENTDLVDLFKMMSKRFVGINYDVYHLYKSLVYFEEADQEPMPKMLIKIDWKEVKKFFVKEIKKLVSE